MNTVKKLDYVLGSAQRELERLITQSRILQPITERLMRQAGLSQGQLQMHKFFAFRAGMRPEDPKDRNSRNFDNVSNLNWQGIFLFLVYTSVVLGFFLFSRNGNYGSVHYQTEIEKSVGFLPRFPARRIDIPSDHESTRFQKDDSWINACGVEANTASSKPQRSSIYIRGISVVQIKKEKISEREN
jgi:hypothetical protein